MGTKTWTSPICTLVSDSSRIIKTTKVVLMLVWEMIGKFKN